MHVQTHGYMVLHFVRSGSTALHFPRGHEKRRTNLANCERPKTKGSMADFAMASSRSEAHMLVKECSAKCACVVPGGSGQPENYTHLHFPRRGEERRTKLANCKHPKTMVGEAVWASKNSKVEANVHVARCAVKRAVCCTVLRAAVHAWYAAMRREAWLAAVQCAARLAAEQCAA